MISSVSLQSITSLSQNFVAVSFSDTTLESTLKKLSLVNIPSITTATVKHISRLFPNLTSLTISKSALVTDEGIISLAKKCKQLSHIEISFLPQITDFALVKLASSAHNLTYIDVSGNVKLTDIGIGDLLTNLRKAKTVIFDDLPLITNKSLRLLLEYPVVYGFRPHTNSDKLERFKVSNNVHLTDISVSYLCNAAWSSLTHLSIEDCQEIGSNSSFFSTIGSINALSTLNLKNLTSLTDESFLACFSTAKKKLYHLRLVDCVQVRERVNERVNGR